MNDDEIETPQSYAAGALGNPDLTFGVSPKRFRAKLLLGASLVAYGVAANAMAWHWGLWSTHHFTLLLLFAPPLTGISILRKLLAARGLVIGIYAHGLLRTQRNEAVGLPWADLTDIRLRTEQLGWTIERDAAGTVAGVSLFVVAPSVRLDKAALTLTRSDGTEIALNATLEDYAELVQEVFARSFPTLFAALWDELNEPRDDGTEAQRSFGPWNATLSGLELNGNDVPWADVEGFLAANKVLCVAFQIGGKPDTAAAALELIPNVHLLIALHAVLRPVPPATPA